VDQRTGHVFKLGGVERRIDAPESAGRIVTEIGKAAGVVVKRYPDGKPDKYASAHDFRRSFGERWAKVVMPAVLQRMMRHKSILTTMRYYAAGDAHALARSIWDTTRKAG
jgi:integrase